MQNEENYQNFHCQGTNQEVGPLGIHLAKKNKKALQPESSTELQDDKLTVLKHKQQQVHFNHSIHLFLVGFMLRNKSLFPNSELETQV